MNDKFAKDEREEMSHRLRELAEDMIEVGVLMEYYGGISELGIHGRELVGAGKIAATWADAIEDGR